MTVVKKIAYNTVFSAGARIVAVALSLFSLGIIARYLGKEGFGDYSLILSFLYVFNILADLGLYSLMTREISRPEADEKKIASNIFTLRLVALFVFLSLAVILVWVFPYTQRVKLGIVIASFGYLFLSASQVLMGIFQKYLKIDKAGIADIVGRLTQLALVVIFIYFRLGLFWLLISLNISCVVNFIFNWVFAKKYVRFGLAFDFPFWKNIFKETLPIAASIVLTLVYFKFDTIFLSLKFINRGSINPMADVGVYNVAYKILEGLIYFPSMFVGLIMPILSRFALSEKEQFKRVFQKTFDVLVIFVVPIMIGLMVLAGPIVVLIGGKDFVDSAPVLKILSIAVGLIFFGNLFGSSIIALNRQKTGACIYLGGMIFNIVTNLIFIPKYSYLGASWTTVATELLVTVLMFLLIYKDIKYAPSLRPALKSLFSGLMMFLFLALFAGKNIFFLIGGGALVYFAFLYLAKGITKKDINLLTKE